MATLSLAAGWTPRASHARGACVPCRAAARAGATDTTAHSSGDVSSTSTPPLPAPSLPRAHQALATAERLEGVGWAFAPTAPSPGSGVAVLFYPGAFVDVESYAVLAADLAALGHAVVLINATKHEEPGQMVEDRTGALACGAAGAGAYTRPLLSST